MLSQTPPAQTQHRPGRPAERSGRRKDALAQIAHNVIAQALVCHGGTRTRTTRDVLRQLLGDGAENRIYGIAKRPCCDCRTTKGRIDVRGQNHATRVAMQQCAPSRRL